MIGAAFFPHTGGFHIHAESRLGAGGFLLVFSRFALQRGTDKRGRPVSAALKPSQHHHVLQTNVSKRRCGLRLARRAAPGRLGGQSSGRSSYAMWHPAPSPWHLLRSTVTRATPPGCQPTSLAWEERYPGDFTDRLP